MSRFDEITVVDLESRTFDFPFTQQIGADTSLDSDASLDAYSIEATTGHGILVGELIGIFDVESGRAYQGIALTSTTNTVGLDTPLNFSYPSATSVIVRLTDDLNVDGSSTRQSFGVRNALPNDIHITRILFQMLTSTAPTLSDFGNISNGIARGLVLRAVNGDTVNYFNVKTNGDLVKIMFDVDFYTAVGQGADGLGGRLTYAGQSKHGAPIILSQGDVLQVIIQDNLTSLDSFKMIASGHQKP